MKGVTIKTMKRKTTISRLEVRRLVEEYFKDIEAKRTVPVAPRAPRSVKASAK